MSILGLYWCIKAYIDWQDKPVLTTITTTAYDIRGVTFLLLFAMHKQLFTFIHPIRASTNLIIFRSVSRQNFKIVVMLTSHHIVFHFCATNNFNNSYNIEGCTVAQWYVICFRIWRCLVQTLIMTKKFVELEMLPDRWDSKYTSYCLCITNYDLIKLLFCHVFWNLKVVSNM